MDDVERTGEDAPPGPAMDRRAFLRRALLVAGGTVGVMGLAGCPSNSEDDDGDNEEDEQENDGGEDQDDEG